MKKNSDSKLEGTVTPRDDNNQFKMVENQ